MCKLLPASVFIVLFAAFQAAQGGSILVYSTARHATQYCYPKAWFDDDLPAVLDNNGHVVTVTDRLSDPEITTDLLSGYDQLWILSADTALGGCFSAEEVDAVLDYSNSGKGILIAADHTYAEGGHYYASDANQIAEHFGVSFEGLADHTPGEGGVEPVPLTTALHPLMADVELITGFRSEALMNVSGAVDVVGSYGGDNLIAVTTGSGCRIVFDASFSRLWDTEIYVGDDNPQYVANIAEWLEGSVAVPSLSEMGLASIILLLLVSGALGTSILYRRRCSC